MRVSVTRHPSPSGCYTAARALGAYAAVVVVILLTTLPAAYAQTPSPSPWRSEISLPHTPAFHQSVGRAGTITVLGGDIGSGPVNDVFWASRNADGTLSGWQPGESLPTPIADAASTAASDHLYLLGGWNGRSTLRSVLRGRFDTRGQVGAWESSSAILPDARKGGAAFTIADRLFVAGGEDSAGKPTRTVWSIPLAEIERGQWQTEEPLPEPVSHSAVLVTPSTILLYGANAGEGRPQAFDSSSQLPLRWRRTETIPEPLFRGAGWLNRSEVLLIGGLTAVARDSAYRGLLGQDGRVDAWAAGPMLPQPRFAGALAETNGDLYFTGGHDGTRFQSSVFRLRLGPAQIAPTPTAIATPEVPLPATRFAERLAELPLLEIVTAVALVSLGIAVLLLIRERFLP